MSVYESADTHKKTKKMSDAQLRWTFFFFYYAYRCFGNKTKQKKEERPPQPHLNMFP